MWRGIIGACGIYKVETVSEHDDMKHSDQLGELVRSGRESLGLTQRLLAQRLGVEASHIAFIETKLAAESPRSNCLHVPSASIGKAFCFLPILKQKRSSPKQSRRSRELSFHAPSE
jgi:hypothetical protein